MLMTPILAHPNGWGHMSGWGWGMGFFGLLFMFLVAALILWAIWGSTRRPSQTDGGRRPALDLLDEGYASGDIERDEYLQRKADLER